MLRLRYSVISSVLILDAYHDLRVSNGTAKAALKDGDVITVRFAGGERKLSVRMLLEMNLLIN